MFKIYLAGPIDNMPDPEMLDWRQETIKYFKYHDDVECLDPCRRNEKNLSFNEIYEMDLKDVENSDMILYNGKEMNRENWGMAGEILYAYRVIRIPVIGFGNRTHTGLFQTVQTTRFFEKQRDALDHICANYI